MMFHFDSASCTVTVTSYSNVGPTTVLIYSCLTRLGLVTGHSDNGFSFLSVCNCKSFSAFFSVA
jgi:hypothetical protein